jgi:hypothetical protein
MSRIQQEIAAAERVIAWALIGSIVIILIIIAEI